MLLWTIIKVALKSLLVNKLRSFLAMLGIIIGVGAVISILALAAGTRQQVMARITSLGTNLLIVRPGQKGMQGVVAGSHQSLKLEDAHEIIQKVPNVLQVAPIVRTTAQVKYFNKNTRTTILGASLTFFAIRNFEIESGRIFTESEVEKRARLAVVGPMATQNLFGTANPIGETIKLNRINFTVIGTLKAKGEQGHDDQIVIPFPTAMKQLLGIPYIHEINIHTINDKVVTQVQEDTTALLRKRHRLQPGMPDDFVIRNLAEIINIASDFTRMFTILLGGIASISLLVGGIGIMNIMLVTVTERTREIGVRKAIGAKERHILQQFLLEAILMSGIGGIIGIGSGIGIAKLISQFTPVATIVEAHSIILALSFAAAVGIFFGYYPARRAAKLDPIEALRYE
jgi:putative ABC transport system permease protein